MTKDKFNRAGWVRTVLLRRPDITLDQLQAEYDKGGKRPRNMRPKEIQTLYQGRSQLQKRWGIESCLDIPRSSDGKINISGMIRLYLTKFGGEHTDADAGPYFETDGIKLGGNQFASIKSTWLKTQNGDGVANKKEKADSPDEQQEKGPRARKVAKVGRKPGRKKKEALTPIGERREQYEGLEAQLDKLIATATSLKNPALASNLRTARRRASAGVLIHEE
jgi:hypothetical protein